MLADKIHLRLPVALSRRISSTVLLNSVQIFKDRGVRQISRLFLENDRYTHSGVCTEHFVPDKSVRIALPLEIQ